MGLGAATEDAKQEFDNDTTFIDLEGRDRRLVMKQVYLDPDFQALVKKVRSKGWTLDWRNPTVGRVSFDDEDGKYDFVVMKGIPSNRANNQGELVTFWIGNQTVDLDLPAHTGAHHIRKTDDFSTASKSQSSGTFGYDEITVMKPADGSVVEKEYDLNDQDQLMQNTRPQSISRGRDSPTIESSKYCTMELQVMEDSKWDCVIKSVIGSGFSGLTCKTCLFDPSKASCIVCIASVGWTGITSGDCISSTGPTITKDVERDWLRKHDIDCAEYAPETDKAWPVEKSFLDEEVPTRT